MISISLSLAPVIVLLSPLVKRGNASDKYC
jgi:hypothetical protein